MPSDLSVTVYKAKEKRTERYGDNGFGPDRYSITVKHGGAMVFMAVAPAHHIMDLIEVGMALVKMNEKGIDQANQEYEATKEEA